MFNTIRAKIFSITFLLFLLWSLVFAAFFGIVYKDGKEFIIRGRGYAINMYEKNIIQQINSIESNALDLALMGEVYRRLKKRDNTGKTPQYFVSKIFGNYPNSLGGGIWYEPYMLDSNKKRFCVYATRDEKGEIFVDKSYDEEKNNYLET
ncbi:hypothetical protein IJ670_01925, partial [bacterium]|nr:hypothetical protein [bacterium]